MNGFILQLSLSLICLGGAGSLVTLRDCLGMAEEYRENETKMHKEGFTWLMRHPQLTSTFSLLVFRKVGSGRRALYRACHLHASHNACLSWAERAQEKPGHPPGHRGTNSCPHGWRPVLEHPNRASSVKKLWLFQTVEHPPVQNCSLTKLLLLVWVAILG